MSKNHGCGNSDCGTSTGICDALTHGSGTLDDWGYWEHPCPACARSAEEFDGVPTGSYWPHTEAWLQAHVQQTPTPA